jgi:hypothetical protein
MAMSATSLSFYFKLADGLGGTVLYLFVVSNAQSWILWFFLQLPRVRMRWKAEGQLDRDPEFRVMFCIVYLLLLGGTPKQSSQAIRDAKDVKARAEFDDQVSIQLHMAETSV